MNEVLSLLELPVEAYWQHQTYLLNKADAELEGALAYQKALDVAARWFLNTDSKKFDLIPLAACLRNADLETYAQYIDAAQTEDAKGCAGQKLVGEALAVCYSLSPSEDTWRRKSIWRQKLAITEHSFNEKFKELLKESKSLGEAHISVANKIAAEVAQRPQLGNVMIDDKSFDHAIERWTSEYQPNAPWHLTPLLSDLFGALHDTDFSLGYDEGAFGFVGHIDQRQFLDILCRFPIPHPVWAELRHSEVETNIELLCSLIMSAPLAFDEEGRWNKSYIAPLLLSRAIKFLRKHNYAYSEATKNTAAQETSLPPRGDYLNKIAEKIVQSVLSRDDGRWLALRWSSHLLEEITSRGRSEGRSGVPDHTFYAYEPWIFQSQIEADFDPALWVNAPKDDFPSNRHLWLELTRIRPCIQHKKEAPTIELLDIAKLSPEQFEQDVELHKSLFSVIYGAGYPEEFSLQSLSWLCVGTSAPEWRDIWRNSRPLRETSLNRSVDPFFPYREGFGRSEADRGLEDLTKFLFSLGVGAMDWQLSEITDGSNQQHDWPVLFDAAMEQWNKEQIHSGLDDSFWTNAIASLLVRSAKHPKIFGRSDNWDHFTAHVKLVWGANRTTIRVLELLEMNNIDLAAVLSILQMDGFGVEEFLDEMLQLHSLDKYILNLSKHQVELATRLKSYLIV